jgi:excisionase family DNA binding protein
VRSGRESRGSCTRSVTHGARSLMGCLAQPVSRLPYLLKAEEAAELLRTSRKAIYTMVERGQLPGVVRLSQVVRRRRRSRR